ncbi:MAG: Arc family DNA-binding protein [Ktedonobacteraceae bacterium]
MKKKAVKDIGINTRYPPDLLDELRKLAGVHERSLNGEIIWALRQYVEQQKKTK